MPKIIWAGWRKWDEDYPEEPMPEHAVKINSPEHPFRAGMKYALPPVLLCFAVLFIKKWICGAFPLDRRFVFAGIVAGLILVPVHELLHAVCFPENSTVYIGLSPEKFAAFAVCHFPLSKRRFVVMSLLPAVLGIVPLLLFCVFPVSWGIASAVCWPAAMIGLVSPYPDYMDAVQFRKQVPDGAWIQSGNDGWHWYRKSSESQEESIF